jgi:hypothetical protein
MLRRQRNSGFVAAVISYATTGSLFFFGAFGF